MGVEFSTALVLDENGRIAVLARTQTSGRDTIHLARAKPRRSNETAAS